MKGTVLGDARASVERGEGAIYGRGPDAATLWLHRADALMSRERVRDAVDATERALALAREALEDEDFWIVVLLRSLGDLLARAGRADAAVARYEEAVALVTDLSGPDDTELEELRAAACAARAVP